MKKHVIHSVLCVLLLIMAGCSNPLNKTSWQVTLKKEDKIPYGSYLAYNTLKYYFPSANITAVSRWYRYNSLEDTIAEKQEEKTLLILAGLDFYISAYEWNQLKEFASAGNEVVLFCSSLDNKVQEGLNCIKMGGREELPLQSTNDARANKDVLRLRHDNETYGYEGRSLQGYFIPYANTDDTDTSLLGLAQQITAEDMPDTLGFVNTKANFLRYKLGDGHITLHAAPLVLSNYFLLQPGNRKYLDGVWQTLPIGIQHVYWHDYYKRSAKGAGLDVLMTNPATRWAIIIGIITLLLYVFFESKRRQRIIPVAEVPANTSVSFVETVGRLYYNKGDHRNLADKMVQHFLEWVRLHYYLNTNEINEAFAAQLKNKSDQPEVVVRRMTEMIHEVRLQTANVSEAYLYELYSTIQLFYNAKNK